ncbi:MAG TPA: hypothetical protein VGW10_08770, partial [Solirubrobacteraceae bacterium]|nr:hypothetical protein [Solirubrobacteraceae bacterium]
MAASAAPFEFAPLEPAVPGTLDAAAARDSAETVPPPAPNTDAIRAEGFNEGYTAGAADARAAGEPAAEALRAAAAELH